jgi:HSP20 family protein
MAKNNKGKGKEIAVKKEAQEKPTAVAPLREWSPLRAWEREFDRMLEDLPFFRWPRLRELEPFRFRRELRLQAPSLDVYEEKNELVVKAEIPGLSKDDIEITLSNSTLTLKGEKKKEEEIKEKDYYRCEREYGSFLRSVDLPAEVETDKAKAVFKNGVLEIRLPKSAATRTKQVQVSVQ